MESAKLNLILNMNSVLDSMWSYEGGWGLGTIGGFRVEFIGKNKRDLETNENRLHHY